MRKLLSFIFTLLIGSSVLADDPNKVISEGLALPISQKAIDTIIHFEVGGRDYYNSNYKKPTVPSWRNTASGVTVGFGFDVGHNTKDQIRKALEGIASEEEILALQSVAGLKGKKAYYNGLPKVKYKVSFTYEEAEKIFMRDSLVRFALQTAQAFSLTPNRLHPHSNGALVSLVFNRGPSMTKPSMESRKEMRWIKYNISVNREDRVPSDIRSMKRLWSYSRLKGLHLRRDAEAKLFEEGLKYD